MPTDSAILLHSTDPDEPSASWDRFDRTLRLVAMTVIFAVVAAALMGVGGLQTAQATARNDQLEVTVTYPEVTRPGLATPFRIAIASLRPGELPPEISVSLTDDYLSMFDENGLDPEPDSEQFDGETLVWIYRLDGEAHLVIDFDGRLQPNVHRGRDASIVVSAPNMAPVVVELHTTVFG